MLGFFGAIFALTLGVLTLSAEAHGDHGHDQEPLSGPHEKLWYNVLPGDGGTQVRSAHVWMLDTKKLTFFRPTLCSREFRPSAASNIILALPRMLSSTTLHSLALHSTQALPTDPVHDLAHQE